MATKRYDVYHSTKAWDLTSKDSYKRSSPFVDICRSTNKQRKSSHPTRIRIAEGSDSDNHISSCSDIGSMDEEEKKQNYGYKINQTTITHQSQPSHDYDKSKKSDANFSTGDISISTEQSSQAKEGKSSSDQLKDRQRLTLDVNDIKENVSDDHCRDPSAKNTAMLPNWFCKFIFNI